MRRLHRWIMRVRPAPLAELIKRILGIERETRRTRDGFLMSVDPISVMGASLDTDRGFEPELSDLLRTVLGAGDVFIDIGANEGYFSLLAASRGARVHAIEPQPHAMDALERNLAHNAVDAVEGNARPNTIQAIHMHRAALGDRPGMATLQLSTSINPGAARFVQFGTRRGRTRVHVPVTTLDAVFNEQKIARARLVKIDCEGAESLVIPGAREVLNDRRIDFLELSYHPGIIGEDACRAIDETLRAAGYECSACASGLWVYHLPSVRGALEPLGPLTAVAPF